VRRPVGLASARSVLQMGDYHNGCSGSENGPPKADKLFDWIRFSHWTSVPFEVRAAWPAVRVGLSLDDMTAAVGSLRAGVGATRMPCFLGDTDTQLCRLPGVATFDYPSIWVLTHRDLRSVKRIETFTQFMSTRLRQLRPVFTGEAGG